MAADSPQKRISAMNIRSPWRRSGVLPDGSIAQGDRQSAFRFYSGILFADASQAEFGGNLIILMGRRRYG